MTNQNYIVTFHGEPITRLTFERSGKANISTGDAGDAIKYAREQAQEAARSIGKGAEVGRVFDDTKFNSTNLVRGSMVKIKDYDEEWVVVSVNKHEVRVFSVHSYPENRSIESFPIKDIIKVLPNKYKGDYMFH